jgi:hypothetical protein
MTRGRVWAYYESDDGNVYALQVDADYADELARGWAWPAAAGTPPYPRGWRARFVAGVDENGAIRHATVASVDADLWTGLATTFVIAGTDGADHICTVFETVQERLFPRPV